MIRSAILSLMVLASCSGPVKEPSVAGSFYPADGRALKAAVDGYLSHARVRPQTGELVALISPHAAYAYSGHVAAHGYKALGQGGGYDTVVLIGSSHHEGYYGASVYARGSFRTPLGDVPIDEELARGLLNKKAHVRFYPRAFEEEHSLETQLPFLQSVMKGFRIVPILISISTPEMMGHLSHELAAMASGGRRVLFVASTDLSHFHGSEEAERKDARMLKALERLSPAEAVSLVKSGEGEMCGAAPVLLTLEVARRLGANRAETYRYAHSGHVTGKMERVVGYASVGIYRDPFTPEDKAELLEMARQAVYAEVRNTGEPEVEARSPRLRAEGAAFVTIEKDGMLRGCIGDATAVEPLYKSVLHNAARASSSDPRFPPMAEAEMEGASLEVSVLSPLTPVADVSEIAAGAHGVLITKEGKSGMLLPRIAREQGWDRETLLRQVSLKAGLQADAWQKGASLFRFTAETVRGTLGPGK